MGRCECLPMGLSASLTLFVSNELGAQSRSWDQMFPPKHRSLHLTLERRCM